MYMYVYAPCCNVLMLVLHAVASGFRHVHSSSTALSWYSLRLHAGYQRLLFKMRVRTDSGRLMECKCALIETMYNYLPTKTKTWWRSTAQVGTKLLYLPSPDPVVYVVPLSHILGKLPLVPAGDFGTIPRSMHGRKEACFPLGVCDRHGDPGSGSALFYINTWAMIWPVDYQAKAS